MSDVDDALLDRVASALVAQPTASMDQVARAGGVSRATLFRRFARRDELVAALCHRAVERFDDATEFLDGARAPSDDGRAGPPASSARGRTSAVMDLVELVRHLAPLGAQYGVLSTQPLHELLEAEVLARAEASEQRIRDLVRRGQRDGSFRVDLDPDWLLTALTWLLLGAADGVRLGRLAPARTTDLVTDTLLRLVRP